MKFEIHQSARSLGLEVMEVSQVPSYRRMNRATVTVPFPKGQPRLVYRSKMPVKYSSAKELRLIACGSTAALFQASLRDSLLDFDRWSARSCRPCAPDRRAKRGREGRGIDPSLPPSLGLIKTVTFHFSRFNEISVES